MRLRIIAYGIAVLLVLAGVSLAAFWATSPPGPHPATAHAALAHELATADDDTRARLLDDATASRLEVSIYDADARLLASNVQPPDCPPDEARAVQDGSLDAAALQALALGLRKIEHALETFERAAAAREIG